MQDLHKVQEALTAAGLDCRIGRAGDGPKTLLDASSRRSGEGDSPDGALEDLDDVQTVYTNLEVTEEVMAQV